MNVGDKVIFTGCFMAATILEIKGKSAIINHCGDILTKRISSLSIPVKRECYINEQEQEHMTNQLWKRGDIIYSILSADGDNVIYRQKQCVPGNQLKTLKTYLKQATRAVLGVDKPSAPDNTVKSK